MCRQTAPGLVEIYRKYKDQDVVFIGLSRSDRTAVEEYVGSFGVAWPNGYGATASTEELSGLSPSVFVIGKDGRIAWNDNMARKKHDPQSLLEGLEAAIEAALAADSALEG